jgi:hypothetical protein
MLFLRRSAVVSKPMAAASFISYVNSFISLNRTTIVVGLKRLPSRNPPQAKTKAMAAVSRLNPGASPFVPMALLPASYHLSPTPAAAMLSPDLFASQFLYPQPPNQLPPAYGWPVAFGGSCCPSGGCKVGASSFLLQAAYPLPVPPPVTVYYCSYGESYRGRSLNPLCLGFRRIKTTEASSNVGNMHACVPNICV